MLEIIKSQFKSGKAFSQSKNFNLIKHENVPKFAWDMYPLAQSYYHELNPVFLFNLYKRDFFNFTNVFTVRDGYVTFAEFILNNFTSFKDYQSNLFLIHPDLARLVPPNLTEKFATWKIVQRKQIKLEEARKVIIFGFACEQYLGDLNSLTQRLQNFSKIRQDAEIILYLPIRKNVFEASIKESTVTHVLMDSIKDLLPGRKAKILTSDQFFELTDFKNTYVYDIALDNFMVSDNYLHYYVQSRGATVNNGSLHSPPKDSKFHLELSLHHELHVCPFPKVESNFTDILFYKKQHSSASKEFIFDPIFHGVLRDIFKEAKRSS